MTGAAFILAVMLLTGAEDDAPDARASAAVSADADRVYETDVPAVSGRHEKARIRSRRSDFDRKAGVAMFEGDVRVDYGTDTTLCSERVFVFIAGTNRLNRIVSLGHVAITNATRVGRCEMAVFRRREGAFEMYGSGGDKARLEDLADVGNAVEGARIRFWLASEQVEVDDTGLEVKKTEGGKML